MTDKSKEDQKFDDVLKRMLGTPHKPHVLAKTAPKKKAGRKARPSKVK